MRGSVACTIATIRPRKAASRKPIFNLGRSANCAGVTDNKNAMSSLPSDPLFRLSDLRTCPFSGAAWIVASHNPQKPGRYVLAIECDGASYHSSYTARDRDRLRQQQLENLGWRFYRIWSTDWFLRKEEEIQRVLTAFQEGVAFADRLEVDDVGVWRVRFGLASDHCSGRQERGCIDGFRHFAILRRRPRLSALRHCLALRVVIIRHRGIAPGSAVPERTYLGSIRSSPEEDGSGLCVFIRCRFGWCLQLLQIANKPVARLVENRACPLQ